MADTRIETLAKLLVQYSLKLKKNDWVEIIGPYIAEPLLLACQVEALKAGAHVTMRVLLPDSTYLFYKHAQDHQLRFVSPLDELLTDKRDAMLFVWGGWNTKELTGIDPKRIAAFQAARRELFARRLAREAKGLFRWVGTMYPTDSSAQDAEMSRSEYEDFVYGAGMVDKPDAIARWKAVSQRQAKLARFLSTLSSVRIVGPDTDITFKTRGRKWINCDGRVNFPDGEIFTSPLEKETEGHIRYTFPAVYGGREVHDVRLTFHKGRVVEARAAKNEELLKEMVKADDGASRVGELAFGTNYSITKFTKNTLFDEKIGGTMHVAIGAALPETGGRNKSGIHWDMVCDTRKGFTVYGDGKPIMKDGKHSRFPLAD